MGMKNIILEGDALTVINKLQTREHNLFPIETLIFEAKLRASQFISNKFNHVRRTNNEVTYLLAKYGSKISYECF
ncbi:hypothetical protein CRYUN_Cryun19dG0056100 [Craigia yunnanensis]